MDGIYIVFSLITLHVFGTKAGEVFYEGAHYYWPMSNTNNGSVIEDKESKVSADLHGVEFIEVSRLRYAASLSTLRWIDVDAGVTEDDCLAFQFSGSSCDNDPELSVSFWIRMKGGKRVLATGSYTNSTDGPGILIEYNENKEMLKVVFTSMKKRWHTSIHLPKYSWCHVTATWNGYSDHGLRVVLDGRLGNPRYTGQDKDGSARISKNEKFGKMITIGRPLDMSRRKDYGRFDIAHLVFFFQELQRFQLLNMPSVSLAHGNDKDLDCCSQKSSDQCYKDPCSSKACANIEYKYRDCVCEKLEHKMCKVSSISMSTPVTTKRISTRTSTSSHKCPWSKVNRQDLSGCGNRISSNGDPLCSTGTGDATKCFYGTCRLKDEKKEEKCFCPKKCSNVTDLTCGDDGITYLNPCVLKRTSCIRKYKIFIVNGNSCVEFGSTPLTDASYYWPFNKIVQEGGVDMVEEEKKDRKEYLRNGGKVVSTDQLGNALLLSGITQWVDIKALKDPCIWKLECDDGISVGFWINFISGDYILAAGGYAAGITMANRGFRLQRDKETKYHTLEVANNDSKWQIYIEPFPKRWVYLSFSWQKDEGLKLYFNGELTFSSNKRTYLRRTVQKDSHDTMFIGRRDSMQDFRNFGKFKIAHLAIWKKVLSEANFRAAYFAHVIMTPQHDACCYSMSEDPCRQGKPSGQRDKRNCICPGYTTKSRRCEKKGVDKTITGCKDKLSYCKRLDCNQDFCQTKDPTYENMCQETCGKCGNETVLDESKCFYGTCQRINYREECSCPSRCNNDTQLTCGDDGFTYQNPCILKRYSCKMKHKILISNSSSCAKSGKTPLAEASYYWPFNKIVRDGSEDMVKEVKKNRKEKLHNKPKLVSTDQLGNALLLSGNKEWVDIKDLKDPCIWKVECPEGISVGFWINFVSGDYILAAGGYAGTIAVANGFRLQRDKDTGYHTLEVANSDSKWQIYIEPFPKRWVYLSFSWKKDEGLKLYFNGELTFSSNKSTIPGTVQKRSGVKVSHNTMFIGRRDNMEQFVYSGNFKIAHLAIWKKALEANSFLEAYKANVRVRAEDGVCCYNAREDFVIHPCNPKKPAIEWDNVTCICPKLTTKSRICEKKVVVKLQQACTDELTHCKKLDSNQNFCQTRDPRYEVMCQQTCGRCGVSPTPAPLFGPKQHFTPQTLIFALLGCVGGLVILLGVTVYFWKVYRTRCYPSETKGREFLM